jgi:hypothetical protein
MTLSTHAIMKPEKRRRPTETGTPVMVRLQPGQLDFIDQWRRKQKDLPSRAEAIRRMLAEVAGRK